ncbi:MAG TPA: CHASE3 domain-containing protein [Falsiroseomonas sp.]|jgi:signal transduction histidine kinase|nr:CHASE3 domain-containing protein [Falsiroseomonas sp.]
MGRASLLGTGGAAVAALAFALLVATALLLNLTLVRLRAASDLVGLTNAILQTSADLARDVVSAETGQRGFLLTGERRYLQPYAEATVRIGADLARLEGLVQVPEQRRRVTALGPLVEAKLAELHQTVALRERSFEEALAVVRTDEGQRLSEEIRGVLAEFDAAERELLAERTTAQERQAEATTALAVASGGLALLAAVLGAALLLRRREERRLRELNMQLEQRVEERTTNLAEANRELDAFAHTVSHDLRAPLRAMRGYAAALEEDLGEVLGEEGRRYVGRIDAAAGRMDALVEDILAYSRLAREDISTGRVELEAVVAAALDAVAPRVEATNASVEVHRPLPPVRAHAAMLRQAVVNLLFNAVTFVASGERPRVTVRAELRAGGATVRLWVDDQGIGIAPTHQERIFQPFERLHGREAYPGTGIGLAIVSRVAERLGGACGVFSPSGAGSRFWIDLPAWRD